MIHCLMITIFKKFFCGGDYIHDINKMISNATMILSASNDDNMETLVFLEVDTDTLKLSALLRLMLRPNDSYQGVSKAYELVIDSYQGVQEFF